MNNYITTNKQFDQTSFPIITPQYLFETQDQNLVNTLNQQFTQLQHDPQYLWENEQLSLISQSEQQIKVFILTWNMKGNILSDQLPNIIRRTEVKHHLIVIGTQECQRSIAQSLFCDSKKDWEREIQLYLGSEFVQVAQNKLNALHLCAFAHISLTPLIQEVNQGDIATGFLKIVGNKGAIAISLQINDKKILFVNNHLKSGQNVYEERDREFTTIKTSLQLERQKSTLPLQQRYHYTVWMGDFNSRISENLNKEQIRTLNFFEALQKDQLLRSRFSKGLQKEFQEGQIRFPPTYKLELNSNDWSKDWRVPGWTDRILFHEQFHLNATTSSNAFQIFPEEEHRFKEKKQGLILCNYDSAYNVGGSDHRAVFAQFLMQI